jgi:hypothetical protein
MSTRLSVHAAQGDSTDGVVSRLDAELAEQHREPRMVFAFYGCDHDDGLLHQWLSARFPGAQLIGGSSSGGVMTHRGVMDERSIGLMLIDDEGGNYGVASGPLGDDPGHSAERLLRQALTRCDCPGELPELIWIYQAPGHEEAVLDGLRRVVGDRCPIVGGSSADNDVTGRWRQLGPGGPMSDGLVVGVLFPSQPLGIAFQGGYEPAGPSGIVTASVDREIISIDGQPAAEVYNRWVDGRISAALAAGGPILSATTLFPIATVACRVDDVSRYLLIHPESVTAQGALRTFCNVEVGARVFAMMGDRKRLVDRAGRVAAQALHGVTDDPAHIAGGLIVYCGGCKMAVGEDIAAVSASVARSLGDAPFLGCFTFGEQGQLVDRNVHGNLMISAAVFSR